MFTSPARNPFSSRSSRPFPHPFAIGRPAGMCAVTQDGLPPIPPTPPSTATGGAHMPSPNDNKENIDPRQPHRRHSQGSRSRGTRDQPPSSHRGGPSCGRGGSAGRRPPLADITHQLGSPSRLLDHPPEGLFGSPADVPTDHRSGSQRFSGRAVPTFGGQRGHRNRRHRGAIKGKGKGKGKEKGQDKDKRKNKAMTLFPPLR